MTEMKIFNVEISGLESSMIASTYPMESKDVYVYDRTPGGSNGLLVYDNCDKTVSIYNGRDLDMIKMLSPTITKLANAKSGSGHDCFLKGINVSFDISYPVYWSPQLQRYHHLDIVSSTSAMHRLLRLELNNFMTKGVEPEVISVVSDMIHIYNKAAKLLNDIRTTDSNIKEVFIRKYYDKNESFWDLHILTRDDSLVNKEYFDHYEKISHSNKWDTYTIEEMFQKIIATCPQGLMKVMRVTTNALQLKTIISQRSGHKLDEWKYFVNWAKSLYFWRFFGMYQDNICEQEDRAMNIFDTLIHLLLRGYTYYRIDQMREDFFGNITPYHYETNGERRYLTAEDEYVRNISDEIDEMLSSNDYTLNTRSYMCQIWDNNKQILIHRDLKLAYKKVRQCKETIKKLENYILQHAHGKMTIEEICDKINHKEEL